jgi:pimeloyl-ACP methyl ester carboxylesterase
MISSLPATEKPAVVFVPGGVMPAGLAYGPLLSILESQIQPILKELEVYATGAPAPDYGLEVEVDGIGRAADAAGHERFHLVGYSAGGASSLAFAASHPARLKSLALIEPAWMGGIPPEATEEWAQLGRLMLLPPDERMRAFMRWQMRPGVEPPTLPLPPGPPPPWMAKRPAGLVAVARAFDTYRLDQDRFRQLRGPVYYAMGSLSTPYYESVAKVLAGLFADMQVEVYDGRSHLDPPHRAEPERFARALRGLWARAEQQ